MFQKSLSDVRYFTSKRFMSHVIFQVANLDNRKTRSIFNIELGDTLLREQPHKLLTLTTLSRNPKWNLQKFWVFLFRPTDSSSSKSKRMRLTICPRSKYWEYPTECYKFSAIRRMKSLIDRVKFYINQGTIGSTWLKKL